MLVNIFESHAHYDDSAFDEDRLSLLHTLAVNRIDTVINVGSTYESLEKTVSLANQYSYIYSAIGIHPSECEEMTDDTITYMENLCQHPKTVAIGEIGLDYYWKEPSREIQKHWFKEQLLLADRTKLPIIVHSRDAAMDTLTVMKEMHAKSLNGVIHCYSYSVEMARDYLNMNYYLGIGGVITYNNAKTLRKVVEYAPLDSLLLETDSPYLTPVPNRGNRNSSLNLPFIAGKIAEIKQVSIEEVIEQTNKNARNLFKKVR